jgi:hypothetical protein
MTKEQALEELAKQAGTIKRTTRMFQLPVLRDLWDAVEFGDLVGRCYRIVGKYRYPEDKPYHRVMQSRVQWRVVLGPQEKRRI